MKDEQALEPHDLRREPTGRHPGEGGGGSLLQGEVFFNNLNSLFRFITYKREKSVLLC